MHVLVKCFDKGNEINVLLGKLTVCYFLFQVNTGSFWFYNQNANKYIWKLWDFLSHEMMLTLCSTETILDRGVDMKAADAWDDGIQLSCCRAHLFVRLGLLLLFPLVL